MNPEFTAVMSPQQMQQVEQLAGEIWRQHYRGIVDPSQIDYMLETFQSQAAIAQQISDEGYHYRLILLQRHPVGYLAYQQRQKALFLSKIYLRCSLHGQGLGWRSACFLRQQALNQGFDRIWLTVNRQNHKAIRAYRAWGFEIVADVVQSIGRGFVMDDHRMEWKITAA